MLTFSVSNNAKMKTNHTHTTQTASWLWGFTFFCKGNDCHLAVVTSMLQAISLDKVAFEELRPGDFAARAVSWYILSGVSFNTMLPCAGRESTVPMILSISWGLAASAFRNEHLSSGFTHCIFLPTAREWFTINSLRTQNTNRIKPSDCLKIRRMPAFWEQTDPN